MTATSPSEDRTLLLLLLALTIVTGLVDAASYLALGHVFTANMTGNVVFLGFAVAGTPGLSMGRSGAALAAFLVGAVIGSRMAARLSAGYRYRRFWISLAFAIEAGLLFAATAVSAPSSDLSREAARLYAVIGLIAVAMGLRNALVRKLAVRDVVTTNVLTTTITALSADLSLHAAPNSGWLRHALTIGLMFLGAGAGAWLLRFSPALTLGVSGAISGLCALGALLGLKPTEAPRAI
jgi:uncharacterized membrane protein YoaK (UPF0700 family)